MTLDLDEYYYDEPAYAEIELALAAIVKIDEYL